MLPELPPIFISARERRHLAATASKAHNQKHPLATFLSAELRRARVCLARELPETVVAMNNWVRFRLDWGPTSLKCRLVYPEDYTGGPQQISLLSHIGVALLGLRAGDRMPVFLPGAGFKLLDAVGGATPLGSGMWS